MADAYTDKDARTKARRLALVSILETVSFLALVAAMLLESEGGVSVLGAIHGVLFLGYAILVWVDHEDLGWTSAFALVSIVTGPIGAILVLERIRKTPAAPV